MMDGIPIKDVPDALLNEVIASLKDFLVALYVSEKPKPHLRAIGSGTLLEIEGNRYILTAAHVWHEAKKAEEIGLVLTDYQSSFTMPRDSISVKELWNGEISEWGPDIALLSLPAAAVSAIAARKSFLNLVLQKQSFASSLSTMENGLWAITGMVGEFSQVETLPEKRAIEHHIHGSALFSSVEKVHQKGDYDYFDLEANLQLPGVPSTFKGVSGGGLWEVTLLRTKSKEIKWSEKRYFRGVAFWQSDGSNGQRIIRCHGPKSIFEKAWNAWALSR